ncbi:hypothetical protein EDD17DRAFT_1580833 [Pisolithus thermaeus]|nr:hypothetical protein EDD17DRAFT_1580833 [Pisolithus thermaeus]
MEALTSTPLQDGSSPPSPPPKTADDASTRSLQDRLLLPPIPAMSSLALDMPSSPVAPLSPSVLSNSAESPTPPAERSKKPSPLSDLIESEKLYVDLLTGVIRKVAAAWSRSNLPPPELDVMFRSIESVYKANRMLLGKLKDIGENPSSPKALGDLLMRWIDDLDRPYTIYAEKYCAGFDVWEPVQSNPKVATALSAFSFSNPPPASIAQTSQLPDASVWTLDALFLLPKGRLQYYRKLYSRLLKSTTPGRSDYRLLTGALEKLDTLLETLDSRVSCRVEAYSLSAATSEGADEQRAHIGQLTPGSALLAGQFGAGGSNIAVSATNSSSMTDKHSAESPPPRINFDLIPPITSVSDLGKRLATEGTLDIFTMEPRQVRLQLLPPSLPYTRELRASVAVVIRITPKSTGIEVVHRHGHVIILSDLFLVCERISPEERVALGVDMRLCYPPISGKVLKVMDVPEQGNALSLSIMRKETLTLEAESQHARDRITKEFMECISFSRTISSAAQEPVPPLPSKSVIPQPQAVLSKSPENTSEQLRSHSIGSVRSETQVINENFGGTASPSAPPNSTPSHSHTRLTPPTQEIVIQPDVPVSLGHLHGSRTSAGSSFSSAATSPESQAAPVTHRVPSLQSPLPSPMHLAHQPPAPQGTRHPQSTFVPGQVIPPARSVSIQASRSTPDGIISQGPNRVHSPPSQNSVGQPIPPASVHSLHHQFSVHNLHRGELHNPPAGVPLQHPPRPATSQTYSSRPLGPQHGALPQRPPSEPSASPRLHKSPSSRSLASQYVPDHAAPPPIPSFPGGLPASQRQYPGSPIGPAISRPSLPSQMGSRTNSLGETSPPDPSPPTSPIEEPRPLGPTRSTVTAQMKCKVFHKQHHAQWKSLGSARLELYRQEPTNIKQLVVKADSKDKGVLISTIVLTDGVERVGKTGVAIELSDAKGGRTGVVYMIQLRSENAAGGLFETLLAGSDRSSK